MPIHDWTKVRSGIFHDFHGGWIQALKVALNSGVLPPEFYALSEQVTVGGKPDVLALEAVGGPDRDGPGGAAVLTVEPATRIVAELGSVARRKKNRLAVREADGDRVVAVVEVVSPGNKDSGHALRSFVRKAVNQLRTGIHLLVIDLHPPTARDPGGVHGAIQREVAGTRFELPADKPLTLAGYDADLSVKAYVEPVAVGDVLPDMPLFLVPGGHVPVPLEATYRAAWEAVPARWRRVIEAG